MASAKTCTKCGNVHDWTPDNFRVSAGRVTSQCLACWKAYQHAKYLEYSAQAKQDTAIRAIAQANGKACGRCAIVKAASDFHASINRADGLQRYCKACHREMVSSRYERKGNGAVQGRPSRFKAKLAAVRLLIKRD